MTLVPDQTSASTAFRRMLDGYGLTTAEILYRRPDAPSLLQSFIWQEHDLFPRFPELRRFLDFWAAKLDGPLHSVRVCHQRLIKPCEWSARDGELQLH